MENTSFELFPLLPKELRLQIWRNSFPSARRILPGHLTAGPAALYANHEAREYGKEFYDWIPPPTGYHIMCCYGWIDFATDIINCNGIRPYDGLRDAEAHRKTRHIHCHVASVYEMFIRFADYRLRTFCSRFPNLEQVDVMVHEHGTEGNVAETFITKALEDAVAGRVEEIKAEEQKKNLLWQPPRIIIDLCPSTKSILLKGGSTECRDAYCEEPLLMKSSSALWE